MGFIYYIVNKVNDKVYIGQTSADDLQKRFNSHVNHFNQFARTGKLPTKLKHAMAKYGVENFSIHKLEECENDELDFLEKFYIKELNTIENGYNMTDGGGGTRGHKWSDESRKKLSETKKGSGSYQFGKELPAKTKAKLSVAFSGENNPFYGKTHTDEVREVLRQMQIGKKHTEESKAKISEKTKGENNPRYGVVLSDATKEKIGNANSKKVTIEGVEYASMTVAAKELLTSTHTIREYLRGERETISVIYKGVKYTSLNALAKTFDWTLRQTAKKLEIQ